MTTKPPEKSSGCENVTCDQAPTNNTFVKGTRVLLAPLLLLAMAMPVKAAVDTSGNKAVSAIKIKNTDSVEKQSEVKNDITLDVIKEKGAIIKKVEKDLETLKIICAHLKSNGEFSKAETEFVDKLLVDYGLSKDGGMKDKLIRILNYQNIQFAAYYDILIKLLTHAQILNSIECSGCYDKGIKIYFEAIKLYREKQQEVNKLKTSI